MVISPLIRRVSIYLVLSSAAVGGINLLDLDQNNAYQIYIPLFIAIYILSRWIDSQFNSESSQTSAAKSAPKGGEGDRGFRP